MKDNQYSTDGFILPRRQATPVDASVKPVQTTASIQSAADAPLHSQRMSTGVALPALEIDDGSVAGLQAPKRRSRRRIVKWSLIVVLLAAVVVGGYLGVKLFMASSNVFTGNVFELLGTGKALKTDQYGRTNILVFGTSEDDPSHQEAAPDLADSIMVLSLDQEAKTAAMFSVPRDLYVKYGKACMSGYEGKINEVYQCNKDGTSEQAGAEAFKTLVGDTFGLDISYYAHVNYTVLRESVDAVGGITVNIESDDPRGILDRNFDWKCGYTCHYVKWPNGPAEMNGEQALALARARNAAGGYGLSRSNFDREQNQQKILIALRDKAVSVGTLANPLTVGHLLDSLGSNVRTNFDAGEIKTLIGLANDIPSTSIKRIDLIAENQAVLTTGSTASAGSVVRPVAGLYDYSVVRSYIRAQFSSDPSSSEQATIAVLNGTDEFGVAGAKAEELAVDGIAVTMTGDAPTSDSYGAVQWFDQSAGDKPHTKQKLTEILGEADSGATLPPGVQSDADFVIIVGNGAN